MRKKRSRAWYIQTFDSFLDYLERKAKYRMKICEMCDWEGRKTQLITDIYGRPSHVCPKCQSDNITLYHGRK